MIVRKREWAGRWTRGVVPVAVMLLAVLAGGAPNGRATPADAPDLVAVDSGQLHGTVRADHRLFAGIPYAAAPVGERRWRPPEPVAAWPGVREASGAGSKCAQGIGVGGLRSTQEDCLYLNVWTPRTVPADGRALPVMVWLHGGGLTTGDGSTYGAAPLVSRNDAGVIVVTVNYRLGALGFLAASALDEGAGSGDYGLMDQLAALRWVQRNIGAFGGDPGRVTVAGESAGAISICALLATTEATGLFQAAVMQSGPCSAVPMSVARANGDDWAAQVGCGGTDAAACLRALPAATLVDRAPKQTKVVYGNDLLARDPRDALKAGALLNVPVFVGSNHDEMAFWAWLSYGIPLGPRLEAADYRTALTAALDGLDTGQIDQVAQRYPVSEFAQPAVALTRAWTDRVVCALHDQIRDLSRRNPTYVYEFDDRAALAPPSSFPMGAYHGGELPSLFDLANAGFLLQGVMSADQRRLADEMRRYWTRFVIGGAPDPAGLEAAPRYDADAPALLRFRQVDSEVSGDFASDHRCDFWQDLPLLP
ncbi:carboxylesterase/lipase family protein [Nocardia jejuensis]|uniref:carboxylesterase/lipase family protein n=1 Tax=Nocardia jejuensis TaxID=328049 RepID=UPI000A01B90D|nr:carboxylesterase family protein [Nocardia jejuensis]